MEKIKTYMWISQEQVSIEELDCYLEYNSHFPLADQYGIGMLMIFCQLT